MILWQQQRAFLKVSISVCSDLAAALIGAAVISWKAPFSLIQYTLLAIVFMFFATALEFVLDPKPLNHES